MGLAFYDIPDAASSSFTFASVMKANKGSGAATPPFIVSSMKAKLNSHD